MDSKEALSDATLAEKRGIRLIVGAARLMMRCAGYVADRQFEANGWKIYHAVDADVIKLYLAPIEMSYYANVFGDAEHTETRELLARLIGDFILQDFSGAGPTSNRRGHLFIVPPHEEELDRVILALSKLVIDTADQLDRKMDVILAELWQRVKGEEPTAVAGWLIDAAPMLVEAFDGKTGPQAELARFGALGESRLLNIERYKEDSPSWAFPLLRLEESEEEAEEFTAAFSAWKERLLKWRSPSQPRHNAIQDAYAVATIEFLNRRMASEHRKLVLVTGTSGIFKAASDYLVPACGQPSETFGDLYIRHPQSFMADPAFFGSAAVGTLPVHPDGGFKLIEWLDLFFPKDAQQDNQRRAPVMDRPLLRTLIDRADLGVGVGVGVGDPLGLLTKAAPAGGHKAVFWESILNEWRIQVHAASVSRNVDSSESTGVARALLLVKWVRNQVGQGFTLEQLRADLVKRAVQSVSSLYSSTSWLGLWAPTRLKPAGIRGIPALRFDPDFTLAREYCAKVMNTVRATTGDREEAAIKVDLAEMYERLSRIDDSHYHGHLIHALAYAIKGDWRATKTLCRIAIRTADALPEEEKRGRRGREAAYLLAIAERRLAARLEDLDVARRFLDEAESRENVGAPRDNRFLSEAIAIETAKINFRVFVGGDCSAILGEVERIIPAGVELLERAASEPLRPAREWVRQQVLTNVLDLALIARNANLPVSQRSMDYILSLVSIASKALREEGSAARNRDAVAEFIYLAALVVFGTDPSLIDSATTKLKTLQFPMYTPFDKARENAFRRLVSRAAGFRGASSS